MKQQRRYVVRQSLQFFAIIMFALALALIVMATILQMQDMLSRWLNASGKFHPSNPGPLT